MFLAVAKSILGTLLLCGVGFKLLKRSMVGREAKADVDHATPTNLGALATTTVTARRTAKKHRLIKQNYVFASATRFFMYFLPSLHDYDVKMPNFMFYGVRKQAQTNFKLEYGPLRNQI